MTGQDAMPRRAPPLGAGRGVALALGLLLAACGGGAGPRSDAGLRDAGVDGAVLLDATSPADSSVPMDSSPSADAALADAGSDAGSASACGGRCDPVEGLCSAGVCLLGSSGPRCAATGGRGVAGDRCAALADCATGLSCFLTREGGVCAPICCPAESFEGVGSCAMGERCGGTGVLVDGTVSRYRRCVAPRPCDVLDASLACDRDEGCYIIDAEGTTDCRVAGSAGAGESCVEQSDCAPGFACSGLVSPSCVRICSLRLTRAACPSGEGECVAHAQSPAGTGLCTAAAARTP